MFLALLARGTSSDPWSEAGGIFSCFFVFYPISRELITAMLELLLYVIISSLLEVVIASVLPLHYNLYLILTLYCIWWYMDIITSTNEAGQRFKMHLSYSVRPCLQQQGRVGLQTSGLGLPHCPKAVPRLGIHWRIYTGAWKHTRNTDCKNLILKAKTDMV
jgi:hypothetical protein